MAQVRRNPNSWFIKMPSPVIMPQLTLAGLTPNSGLCSQ